MSRCNVSRMLQTARRRPIVRFDIRYPLARDTDLEERVRTRFAATSVREVIGTTSATERHGAAPRPAASIRRPWDWPQ